MRTDDVIHSLVAELRPVRRLRGVGWRGIAWGAFALAGVCLGAIALGAGPNLPRKLAHPSFVAENAALLILFAVSAWSAFQLSVPGVDRRPLARALPAIGLVAWFLLLVVRLAGAEAAPLDQAGWNCIRRLVWLAAAPAAVAFLMLRRAAPLRPGWAGLHAMLSAGALGVAGMQALCKHDDPAHILSWHLVPVLIVALLGLAIGRLLLATPRGGPPTRAG
jgi:hypothetical protein